MLAALALGAALVGCATPPPPPPPVVAAPPPPVDGRYRGTARLVRAERPGCPRSGARVLQVTGNAITLPYTIRPRQLGELTAEIQPNGVFQASDGLGTLDGTLRGGQLEITISSAMCENHWSLTRVD
jgi:hypothetical protein